MESFDFAAWLKSEQEKLGMNESEFAKYLFLPKQVINHYLRGIHEPRISTFIEILNGLGKQFIIEGGLYEQNNSDKV